MRYRVEEKLSNASLVWWVMDGYKRIAGVHLALHNGESIKAQHVAQKIADALNAMETE